MRSLIVALALLVPAAAAADPTAQELLAASDRARGGLPAGITWTVKIHTVEDGEASERTFRVKARGDDALAEALAPPRHKGEVMLFNDRTIWFVKPGLKKPVSISARQRLSGEAANGDIASTRYARDYEGTIAGVEPVGGVEAYRLELKARDGKATYDRVRYWISKEKRLGVKAEFLTASGELFKTAIFEYGNQVEVDGATIDFVRRMVITDASGASTTTLTFEAPKAEAHPGSLFNVNNVGR